MKNRDKITVTRASLPPLEEFTPYLEQIWESRWLTNNGPLHRQLEQELADYLGVKYISLFCNGTLALLSALQALGIHEGEVITTPFSFVATTHALWWNRIDPVFADIEPQYLNLDPGRIEAAITERTRAIMPVHTYGNPCRVDQIERIAARYDLKVIYDAAHAFGVKCDGRSVLNCGDLSVLSFHATKVYNTIEGGAIVCHTPEMKHHIDNLKNFGFRGETTVEEPGINAKMNEVQAACGLLQLRYVDGYIERRKQIAALYRELLKDVQGIRFAGDMPGVEHNYSYFPVLVDEQRYGMSRDELYEKLKRHNIFARRYFYPLISDFAPYRDLPSARKENLPVASKAAEQVLCLPIYPDLPFEEVESICSLLNSREE
ncbi:DegT/DnrJ/EryC1/StrS family aminotransferase [uncultured Alistipes sp.]|jgi:degT/dnrJ/eryC1/strS aminotransferase|uniref:DegT/DnrJ/EryC1/StrS family aminotransferase n=1 Tax=uncultured Alistipes sp. TaxID=538949 RepID=UPI0025ED1C5D|nr:DegT/DnrJ/EryC1/StrS family aminotransferase [uncultured Alistipes sp.]